MPSFSSSSRAARKLSLSLIAYAFFTRLKSEIVGRKSSPMPSTIQLADFSLSVPSLMYSARIEPTGSARIISTPGACCAKQRDSPLIVPELPQRSEEHTSELQSLMRISYAVFCLKKKTIKHNQ